MTVTVPAIRDFEWQGGLVRVGDPVTVTPVEAAVLRRRGLVTLDRVAAVDVQLRTRALAPEPAPAPDPEPPPMRARKRAAKTGTRQYRRRDLVAESE